MPGGLRRLRHVIRPGPARAFPARAPPPGPHFPAPPPAQVARVGPLWGRRGPSGPSLASVAAQPAPRARLPRSQLQSLVTRPSPSWVMPQLHLHRVTFGSRAWSRAHTFPSCRFSRLEFPLCLPSPGLCHHPIGSQMWQSNLYVSGLAPSGVCTAIWGTGNNASEVRLGGIGSCGREDGARSTDHLFTPGSSFGLTDVFHEMDRFLKIKVK